MTRILLLAAALLALAAPAAASAASLVEVPISGPQSVAVLERLGLDVTHDVDHDSARVVLRDGADRRTLAGAGFPSRTVVPDFDAAIAEAARTSRRTARSALPTGRDSYRVITDYETELRTLAEQYPGLVRRFVLSKPSVEGREIAGVELAKDVNRVDDGRPVAVFFGLHHAREWPSGEVNMEFAHDLAKNYGTDDRITALLDRVRVIVVPLVNPDGFIVSRGTDPDAPAGEDPLWRKNCRPLNEEEAAMPCVERSSVDLNRNYGAGWGGTGARNSPTALSYRGPGPFSEPESQAVHEMVQRRQVMHVQSTHNIIGQVLRQPGFKDYGLFSPDEHIMRPLGDEMGEATSYDSLVGYDLYDVHGATEDWNYIAQGAMGYTIELGPKDPSGQAGGVFMGPYQSHVVDQYLGGPSGGPSGRGIRDAFLMAAEQAGNAADHGVLDGEARAGHTLRVRKDFTTATARRCPDSGGCNEANRMPELEVDDFIETTLTVPESGRFEWHVGPSTRPWVGAAGRDETWVITCEAPDGAVLARQEILVRRGARLTFRDACDATAPVVTSETFRPPPGGGGGGVTERPGGGAIAPPRNMRLYVGPRRVPRSALRRRGYLRVAMKVTGTTVRDLRVLVVNSDREVVAGKLFSRLAGRKAVRLRLRRTPPRGLYRLSLRGTAANGAVVGSAVRLRIR
ncbi:MAG TPA: M14 family zinc carboxypeptidase [Solirubrobacteraceae bacterium]|nr:M14 family zinc carboxypeptidase [Solirubrobacteraceae bacterium]